MSDPSGKIPPEHLELRARPRPIRRLNKRALMAGCGLAALCVAGATVFALRPARLLKSGDQSELYNTDRKQTADGLSKLPKTYGDLPPKLGPPSPGDVGHAFVEAEKKSANQGAPFQADPEQDAERAERVRQERIARQALESGLFVRLSEKQSLRKEATPTEQAVVQPSAFRPVSADQGTGADASSKAGQGQGLTDRSSEIIPSSQARKLAFISARPDKETTNPHSLATAPSPYAIMAGTIIPASLITGLNSDLPGETIAQVTENVYDTVSGEHLLIPQGARLVGKYDSVVAYGQKRGLVVWSRLLLPNGNSIQIDNLPAADVAGYTGLEDQVDVHTWQLLKGIAMATLLGVGTQLSLGSNQGDLVRAFQESVQQTTDRAGQRLVERELDVQPTITVRPGWPLRVIVSKDLVLKPYHDVQTAANGK